MNVDIAVCVLRVHESPSAVVKVSLGLAADCSQPS